MSTNLLRRLAARPLAALALAGALAACDNPVDEGEEHTEPSAVVVQDVNGTEIARATVSSATGSITVRAGQTRDVRVLFVDDAGAPVAVDGSELSLRGTVTSPTVATFTKTSESGARVAGLVQGTTSVNLQLMHGSHSDFSPRPVAITVTP